jgi:hypothetical protein
MNTAKKGAAAERRTMQVLAIDPGSEQSAWVLWDGADQRGHGKVENESLRQRLANGGFDDASEVVIERVGNYGMVSGLHIFETCYWTGRFTEAAVQWYPVSRLYRHDVKMHLCHSKSVTDSIIKSALVERFGGKAAAIGTVKAQGRFYGLKADEWQALALAITFYDQQQAAAA